MVLIVTAMFLMMLGGCGYMERFQITNATGKEVAVTSAHTGKTVRIPNQKAALVPHSLGDITVTLPDGTTWVYKNLEPGALRGTQFGTKKSYLLFGYQDGYFFRGSWTANLLLNRDARMYAVPPDVKDVDVEKLEEPKGFPVKPEEAKGAEKAAEQPCGKETEVHK
jgi:hypothetical protein